MEFKSHEEMTEEEKKQAFNMMMGERDRVLAREQKTLDSRERSRIRGMIKRQAFNMLTKAHRDEYNRYLAQVQKDIQK